MKKILKYCLIIILGNIYSTYSQSNIQGRIVDTLDIGIPMISVVVKSVENDVIVGYDYTNADGEYRIELKSVGEYILSASGMSYQEMQTLFTIDSLIPSKKVIETLTLKYVPFELDEVVVNADKPIFIKKDTISIKVESFINGSEEVVEDILKKLPGIEVTEDGTVMVQGKGVEKVMVEGDDLFEKGYKLLTKNLHAGVIERVEILEHFSDNALLKNLEDSDNVALNITLKDDQKKALFGNASIGYGTDQFYEEKLNLISFNDKTKYYFFGNLNNVGSDAVGDIYQIIYPDVFTSNIYIGDGMGSDKLVSILSNEPNLKEERYNFNNAELASLNGIYNPSDKLKLKGLLFFTSDENTYTSSSVESFILPPTSFVNNEIYELRKNSMALSGKWDAILNINENTQIEYVGRYNYGNFKDRSTLVFNDTEINESLKSISKFTDHRINLTKRLNNYQAILITGRYLYDKKPQDYSYDTFLFSDLFPSLENIASTEQSSENSLSFLGIEGSYLFNKSNSNLNLKAGFSTERNLLNSQLSFTDLSNNTIASGSGYNNNFRYSIADLYLKARYKYSINKISIRSGLELHKFFVETDDNLLVDRQNPTNLIPSLGFSWQINKKNKLFSSYKYSTENLPFNSLFNDFILTSYRSFKRGLGEYQQLKGSFFLVSYILGNWSDSFLINTSFILNKDNNYISNNSFVQPEYFQSTAILLNDREFYSLNFTGDKFIDQVSANIKLNGSISKNSIQNIVNNTDLRTVVSNTFTYGAEYRSVFNGVFNFHFGTKWTTSVIETTQKRTNTNNISFLDANFNFSKKFSMQLQNERFYFGNLIDNRSFWFTDIDAQYIIKENKLKFKFSFNNIFNTNRYSDFIISDTGSYRSQFNLLPRYVFLKMEYRF